MNFFPNNLNPNELPYPFHNNYEVGMNMNNQNIFYKINEMENRIKKIEQRISRLENTSSDIAIPDNSLYMI